MFSEVKIQNVEDLEKEALLWHPSVSLIPTFNRKLIFGAFPSLPSGTSTSNPLRFYPRPSDIFDTRTDGVAAEERPGIGTSNQAKKNQTKKDKIILYIQYVRFYIDTLNGTVTPRVQREERRTEREFLLRWWWWWWWCVLLRSLQKTKSKKNFQANIFFQFFFFLSSFSSRSSTQHGNSFGLNS